MTCHLLPVCRWCATLFLTFHLHLCAYIAICKQFAICFLCQEKKNQLSELRDLNSELQDVNSELWDINWAKLIHFQFWKKSELWSIKFWLSCNSDFISHNSFLITSIELMFLTILTLFLRNCDILQFCV